MEVRNSHSLRCGMNSVSGDPWPLVASPLWDLWLSLVTVSLGLQAPVLPALYKPALLHCGPILVSLTVAVSLIKCRRIQTSGCRDGGTVAGPDTGQMLPSLFKVMWSAPTRQTNSPPRAFTHGDSHGDWHIDGGVFISQWLR